MILEEFTGDYDTRDTDRAKALYEAICGYVHDGVYTVFGQQSLTRSNPEIEMATRALYLYRNDDARRRLEKKQKQYGARGYRKVQKRPYYQHREYEREPQ